MSNEALNWAFSQDDLTSSQKFLLVALANRADKTFVAWPSWSRLEKDTSLNRKTIATCLKALEEKGKIERTGEYHRQVPVYRLSIEKLSTTSTKFGTGTDITTSPKNGTGTSTKFGMGTSTKNGTQNHNKKPKGNPKIKNRDFFSLFSPSFFSFCTERLTELGVPPTKELIEQIVWYAQSSENKRSNAESVEIAFAVIAKGEWQTPYGYIKAREEKWQQQKAKEASELASQAPLIRKTAKSKAGSEALTEMWSFVKKPGYLEGNHVN